VPSGAATTKRTISGMKIRPNTKKPMAIGPPVQT
jgi:hypothetical protein